MERAGGRGTGRGLDHQAGVEVGDAKGQNLNDSSNCINRSHPAMSSDGRFVLGVWFTERTRITAIVGHL